ncbi:MAG: GNAT family N-acetyltransferase [Rubrobacteraceae bacterium]|nr:GNAT family N-acetyltransferase [Rubrobacteraceae bacterium]
MNASGERQDLGVGYLALDDGTLVAFRPIRVGDVPALKRFHRRLSKHSIYLRYFGAVTELSEKMARSFVRLDGEPGLALVALDPGDQNEIVAVVLYVREGGTGRAEYAALVEDRWQGKGLGLGLTRRLIKAALERGVDRFWGLVLPENARMLNLLRDLGLPERLWVEDGVEHVEIELAPGRSSQTPPLVDGQS